MRQTTKLIRVSAVVAAALMLAGCSSFNTATGSPTSRSKATATTGTVPPAQLKIATLSGYEQFTEPQAAFTQLHPGVTFQPTQSPSNTYQTLISAQLDSGTAPDIMDLFGGSGNALSVGQLAPKGYLEDLSDQPWANKMPSVVKSDLSIGGKLYGQASYVLATGVVYNKKVAKSLKVTVPTTFTQLIDMCKAVSKKGIIPISLGNQTGSENELVPGQLANDIIYSKDPKWAQEIGSGKQKFSGNSLWNSALKKGVEEYVQMNDAHCFEQNSTGVAATESYQQVATGTALGTDIFANAIPGITADNPKVTLGTFSLPATDNAKQTWVTGDLGFVGGINAKTSSAATAKAYLDYLAQPAVAAKAAEANYGFATDPGKNTKTNATLTGLAGPYDAGRFALFPSAYYPNYNVKLTIIAQMEGLLAGSTTIPDAMKVIEQSYAGS